MKNLKIFILSMFIIGFSYYTYSQDREIIYFTLTSISEEEATTEGIIRSLSDNRYVKYPSIYFNFESQSRGVCEYFIHFHYIPEELAKTRPVKEDDLMEIITKPKSFLNTIHTIDLDQKFKIYNQDDWQKYGATLKGKKLYIIDKSEMTADSIKLIQVRYSPSKGF